MTAERLPSVSGYVPHVGWFSHEPGDELMSLLRQGHFEAAEQAFVWLYLRPGDWFFDCGAHIGLYSVLASRVTANSTHILSVEASDSTAGYLEENLGRNGVRNAQVIRGAVWRVSGAVAFGNETPGRAAYAGIDLMSTALSSLVKAVTLDELVSLADAKEIQFLKIDVEGAELSVLEGGTAVIAANRFPLVMIEFNEHNLQRHGVTSQKLAAELISLGYELCEFSVETQRLEHYRVEGPIWYKNIFACRDRGDVNSRLSAASSQHREIAQDILDRARACARFKELEDLDMLRKMPEVSRSLREWAERTEKLLVEERQSSQSLREWAERTEMLLAQERESSQGLREWAERTEKLLVEERQSSQSFREWAERTEMLLAQERERLSSLESEVSLVKAFVQRFKWMYWTWLRCRTRSG